MFFVVVKYMSFYFNNSILQLANNFLYLWIFFFELEYLQIISLFVFYPYFLYLVEAQMQLLDISLHFFFELLLDCLLLMFVAIK